jgi:hypothetical protein
MSNFVHGEKKNRAVVETKIADQRLSLRKLARHASTFGAGLHRGGAQVFAGRYRAEWLRGRLGGSAMPDFGLI